MKTNNNTEFIQLDLHIHSCLSACGSLEQSPSNLLPILCEKGISIAAITDHNSTLNYDAFFINSLKFNLCIFPAVEIQTEEEIHVIVVFPDKSKASNWQNWIDSIIPFVPLDAKFFGDEPVIDQDENIVMMCENLLTVSLPVSLTVLEIKAEKDNLIYFPAHINADTYSVISQLGFIPPDHLFKIAEITRKEDLLYFENNLNSHEKITFIANSDSHYNEQIGKRFTRIYDKQLIENYIQYLFFIEEKKITKDNLDLYINTIEDLKVNIYNRLKYCLENLDDRRIVPFFVNL